MINSRKITDLDPVVQPICRRHIDKCMSEGIDIILTATYRDVEQQDALYRIGRELEDRRQHVTNAKGGYSWHQYRVAWDVVPIIGGKAVWNDPHIWETVIRAGIAVGAEAGALWKTFKDQPHFQVIPKGLTFIEAMDRMRIKGTIFI